MEPVVEPPETSWEQAALKLARVDALSLDIFDTCILRACLHPTDVFALAGTLVPELPAPLRATFQSARITAERHARDLAWNTHQAWEVTFDALYESLAQLDRCWAPHIAALRAAELAAERAVCMAQPHALAFIEKARAQGLKIVLTSDMYLPEWFVRELLSSAGIRGWDHLFLSSTVGRTKAEGGLFEHLIRNLGVKPERILHVGDHPKNDTEHAQRHGLLAHTVRRSYQVAKSETPWGERLPEYAGGRPLPESLAWGLLFRESLRPSNDPWDRLGYTVAGPLFHAFICWTAESARARGVDQLSFLARDGRIMKAVYDRICPPDAGYPSARYLYTSRRAMGMAAIREMDAATWYFLQIGTKVCSVRVFIEPFYNSSV